MPCTYCRSHGLNAPGPLFVWVWTRDGLKVTWTGHRYAWGKCTIDGSNRSLLKEGCMAGILYLLRLVYNLVSSVSLWTVQYSIVYIQARKCLVTSTWNSNEPRWKNILGLCLDPACTSLSTITTVLDNILPSDKHREARWGGLFKW